MLRASSCSALAALTLAGAAACTGDDFVPPAFELIGPGADDAGLWYVPGMDGIVLVVTADPDRRAWTYMTWGKLDVDEPVVSETATALHFAASEDVGDGELAMHDGPGHLLNLLETHVAYPDRLEFTFEQQLIERVQILAGDIGRLRVGFYVGEHRLYGHQLLEAPQAREVVLGEDDDRLDLDGRYDPYIVELTAGPTMRQRVEVHGISFVGCTLTATSNEAGLASGQIATISVRAADAAGDPVMFDAASFQRGVETPVFRRSYVYEPATGYNYTVRVGPPTNGLSTSITIHGRL